MVRLINQLLDERGFAKDLFKETYLVSLLEEFLLIHTPIRFVHSIST